MSKNGKVKTRTTTRKPIVSHNGGEVLQWRFNISSVFQLVSPNEQSAAQQKEDNLSEQEKFAEDGVDSDCQSSAIQLSFDFDLWSKLPDEWEKG